MNYLVILFLCLLPLSSFGQVKMGGTITDIYDNNLPNVNIIAKSKKENKIIQFSSSDKNGNYSISLQSLSDDIVLSFSCLGYEKQTFTLSPSMSKKLDVSLFPEEFVLKEIEIAGSRSVRVSGDTVEYNTKFFSDGTEKAIEDVIKKLPGVDVSSEGKIRFKGREIDKILLDGTDLFSTDYRLASKNIPAKFINKIQAIENYHDNSLLKNAEQSEKIILNLSLDEDNLDRSIFGELSVGGGYENIYAFNSNLFTISKKIKVYNTTSVNNTEQSSIYSSRDNIANLYNDYQPDYANSSIVNNDFTANVDGKAIHLNDVKREFNSFNVAYQPDSKLELTGNVLFSKKKDSFYTFRKTVYEDGLSIEEHSSLEQTPQSLSGNLKIDYAIRKNMKLVYTGLFDKDTEKGQTALLTSSLFEDITKDKHRFLNNKLDVTVALKDSAAFLFRTTLLTNKNRQGFTHTLNESSTIINQKIRAENTLYTLSANYYKKNRKDLYYTLATRYSYQNQEILATPQLIDASNAFSLKTSSLLFNSNLHYTYFKSKIRINMLFGYRDQELLKNEQTLYSKGRFEISPQIQYSWESKPHSLAVSVSYSQSPLDLNNHVQDSIYANYRNLTVGTDKYNISDNIRMGFLYSYFDIFNQTTFIFGGNRLFSKNVFANKLLITPQITYSSKIEDTDRITDILFINYKKYLDPLRLSLNMDNSLFHSKYYNAINSDTQRKNNTLSFYSRLSIKSIFDFPLNYNIGTIFRYSRFKTGDKSSNMNNYSLFQDILMKKGNFKSKISFDECFLGKEKKFHFFISSSIDYYLPKSDLSFKIDIYNILNRTNLKEYSVNDYSSTEVYYRILPRQVLFSVNLRF